MQNRLGVKCTLAPRIPPFPGSLCLSCRGQLSEFFGYAMTFPLGDLLLLFLSLKHPFFAYLSTHLHIVRPATQLTFYC